MIDYKAVKSIKNGKLIGYIWYIDDCCECFEDPVYDISQQKYKYAVEVHGGYFKFKTIDDMIRFYEVLPNTTKGIGFISKDEVYEDEEDK